MFSIRPTLTWAVRAAVAGLIVGAPLFVSAQAPECQFTAAPTPEQLAACQAAMANAAQSQGQQQMPASPPAGTSAVPPTGAPTSIPSMPTIPTMPTDIPTGPPAGIQMGPSAEQMVQIDAAKLKGMKAGLKGMESGYAKMASQYSKLEKSGTVIPQQYKDKLAEAKGIIDAVKGATSSEQLEDVDTDRFGDLLDELGSGIAEIKQQAEMLKGLKRAAASMKTGVKMFDVQIAKLAKQNVAVPTDIIEVLNQVKGIISGVEGNKTWDDLQALGIENIDELFDKLDDGRERIIMLSRWPQALKQIDAQLAAMDKTAARLKTAANKLKGGEVDVSENLAQYVAGVAELRQARNDADAAVRAGGGMEAFDLLEETFFGKLESVIENQRVIETMSNMGRFVSEYRKATTSIQQQITALTKKKINTTELNTLFAQFKSKGDGLVALLKVKPVDTDAVLDGVNAFEDLRLVVVEKAADLANAPMPWEKGVVTVKEVTIPKEMDNFLTKSKEKEMKTEGIKAPVIRPAAGAGGSLLLEAENETASSILPLAQRPAVNTKEVNPNWRPPYSGTGDWYLAAKGEWLSYDFTIAQDGTYNVWIRDYVDKFQAKGVRRIVVSFDGIAYGTFAEVDKPTSGAKGDFGWHQVGTGVVLSAGNHTMKVMKEATTSGAAVLDAFYLTTGSEVPPEK